MTTYWTGMAIAIVFTGFVVWGAALAEMPILSGSGGVPIEIDDHEVDSFHHTSLPSGPRQLFARSRHGPVKVGWLIWGSVLGAMVYFSIADHRLGLARSDAVIGLTVIAAAAMTVALVFASSNSYVFDRVHPIRLAVATSGFTCIMSFVYTWRTPSKERNESWGQGMFHAVVAVPVFVGLVFRDELHLLLRPEPEMGHVFIASFCVVQGVACSIISRELIAKWQSAKNTKQATKFAYSLE